jgi:hypothetical protein
LRIEASTSTMLPGRSNGIEFVQLLDFCGTISERDG